MKATLRIVIAAAGLTAAGCAAAAEQNGCDKFKWPTTRQQAALAAPAAGPLAPGAALPAGVAARLKLVPFAEAKFALSPERAPKFSPSYAGAFALDAPAAPGVYAVGLSARGWIDVVQDGKFLKAVAFSEAAGCPSLAKIVKFRLAAGPATLQLSGLGDPEVAVVVSPD